MKVNRASSSHDSEVGGVGVKWDLKSVSMKFVRAVLVSMREKVDFRVSREGAEAEERADMRVLWWLCGV
jgi:hypothetical protein